MAYFFDTYAIIELINKNPPYERFKSFNLVTSILNIGEVYGIFLREGGKEKADDWFKEFNCDLIEITPKIIVEAVHFRFIHKGKNISLVDSVGYILAQENNIKFLTGDKEFHNLPNVEFIK